MELEGVSPARRGPHDGPRGQLLAPISVFSSCGAHLLQISSSSRNHEDKFLWSEKRRDFAFFLEKPSPAATETPYDDKINPLPCSLGCVTAEFGTFKSYHRRLRQGEAKSKLAGK